MHGGDYEEYVRMDVSADVSLCERNVTSAGHQREVVDSGVCTPKLDEQKKGKVKEGNQQSSQKMSTQ
jgi:hypothetical protein